MPSHPDLYDSDILGVIRCVCEGIVGQYPCGEYVQSRAWWKSSCTHCGHTDPCHTGRLMSSLALLLDGPPIGTNPFDWVNNAWLSNKVRLQLL